MEASTVIWSSMRRLISVRLPHAAGGSIQQACRGNHLDALARLTDLHGGVDRDMVVHAKIDLGTFERLEPRGRHRNCVRAWVQVGQQIVSTIIGGGVASHAGGRV